MKSQFVILFLRCIFIFWKKEFVIKYEGFRIFDKIIILILTSGLYFEVHILNTILVSQQQPQTLR